MGLPCAHRPELYPEDPEWVPVKDPLRLHHAVDDVDQVVLGCDHFRGRVVLVHRRHLFQNEKCNRETNVTAKKHTRLRFSLLK